MVTPADLDDLLRTRRSVRRFRPDVPPRADLEALLAAAVTAPSASNGQPWRFVVVLRGETIAAMAAAVRAAVDRIARHLDPASEGSFRAYGDYFARFEAAPVVIAALHRPLRILSHLADPSLEAGDRERIDALERGSGLMGTAMALENLLLAAHARGLGASGMTGPLVAADALREILEIAPSWELGALVPVGYPAEDPAVPERKPWERVTRWIE